MNSCDIKVSIGELYDKYTILQIKKEKVTCSKKLVYINREIEYLKPFVENFSLDELILKKLKNINQILWEVEDKIRIKEVKNEFDNDFISLARLVYKTNDQRHIIKNEIDNIFNSEIKEIKTYV